MNRYHIKIGFRPEDISRLKEFTASLNNLPWDYSEHCLDNIKYRIIDLEDLLLFIKNTKLEYNQVFEYYQDNDYINKVCYRLAYKPSLDIILVISNIKEIITVYLNSADDNHYTLKENLYNCP